MVCCANVHIASVLLFTHAHSTANMHAQPLLGAAACVFMGGHKQTLLCSLRRGLRMQRCGTNIDNPS